MIISNLTISIILSLVYMSGLCWLYFSKARINNSENKIYKFMIILNIFGLILQFLCDFVSLKYYEISFVVSELIFRSYLVYFLVWLTCMIIYLISIIEIKHIHKFKKYIIICCFISVLIDLLLPFSLYRNISERVFYTYGLALDFVYFLSAIGCCLMGLILILNRKSISKKKSIPIYVFIVCGVISAIIQKINPGLVIITLSESFISCLMYFTIENPDMKLLEEVHKSKEISDAANEEKTMFLYNMTQEIRNTTNDINDNADMILDSVSLEEDKECAREIKGITSRFNSMTNELFDVSKIDASNIKVYNSKYNIKNILKEIVTLYNKTCKDKGLTFRVNIDHDVPEILYGDSIGLKEVLNIIMDNSVKYTKEGFIEFNVNTIIKNDICRLIMTVEDSGVGIKSEDINKMKIGNKSLSKANKLITLMNGAMVVSSNYGMGTKVKIVLDQKIELNMNEDIVKYSEIYDNIKLLMIDDSESGIKIIEKLIKGSNIKMDFAMNGKECIEKIKTYNKYDIILLDEQLSQISAMELIKKIKDIRNFDIPIILLTKDNSYEYNDEFKKLGFSDYLLKPVKKEELLNKINEYTKNK